jgi:signal transduction histidine kinase
MARPSRRQRGLLNEIVVRASVAILIFIFYEALGPGLADPFVPTITATAVLLNVPYYLLGRTRWRPVEQAYGRMIVDIVLITLGLYGTGGLAAAAYVSIYAVVPVYAGIALSSTASVTATVFSSACCLGLALAQHAGWLAMPRVVPQDAWATLTFNLVVLNVIGISTAGLAHALHQSRRRLNDLNQELARRSERLITLVDVTRGLMRGLDLPVVLSTIASSAARVFGGEAGFRLLEGDELVRVGATEGAAAAMARERIRVGESLSGRVAATGDPLVIANTFDDSRLVSEHRAAAQADRTGALLCVPIRIGDRIAGTLHVFRERGHQFDAAAEELARQLADQAGIAIENARLYAEAQRALQELSTTQAQLVQAQKMEAIGRLAGGIAHDFANLLMVIMGRGAFIRQRLEPGHALRREIEVVESAAARATQMTRQLLAFSRQQVFELQRLDVNAIVEQFAPMLRRLIGEDIELVHVLDPALGTVQADASQLQQVVMNLAVNARDAMPRGGQLTIETANVAVHERDTRRDHDLRAGRYVMLTVTDTGVGMDAHTLAHIFEPFFTSKAPGEGTGLGLATVYGIVKQSEGHIWAETEPGRGTTFRIYLPSVDEKATRMDTPTDADVPGGSETLLVVEDDTLVRQLAREVLEW